MINGRSGAAEVAAELAAEFDVSVLGVDADINTESGRGALLAACRRVAENQSIPKQDATLKVGSKLLCWSAMEKLHLKLSFPREDPVGVLLEEFYPALLVCMVDDLLGEGARECEDLEPALHSVASSHSEARTLVLQYMHECISTDSIDAARFQKPIPLYKAAAVEAAAAAADLTPDTLDEAPLCLYLIEETRRLAAIARSSASSIDITRWAAVRGGWEGEEG